MLVFVSWSDYVLKLLEEIIYARKPHAFKSYETEVENQYSTQIISLWYLIMN